MPICPIVQMYLKIVFHGMTVYQYLLCLQVFNEQSLIL